MKKILSGIGIFLLIACLRHMLPVSPQAHPALRTTARQILDQSEPLCAALTPSGASLQLAVQLAPGTEAVRPIWNVECTDRYGQDMVNLRWSADTGRLLSAGTQYVLSRGKTIQLANERQAREAAQSWLKTLGLTADASHWRIDRPRYLPAQTTWIVPCASTGQHALINLDARSGLPHYILTNGYIRLLPFRSH
ncbi:MAG TPA: hypothetical protein VFA07_18500 [Chthonomonadaceae bacterium]|nr:hypothetical protein [Chthonomonadaceae bacterium]